MEFIVVFGLGVVLGSLIRGLILRAKCKGELKKITDMADPDEGPYLFLNLYKSTEISLKDNGYVVFKIKTEVVNSQK